MTWTAEQERAHRQDLAERRKSTELVQTWFSNFPCLPINGDEAANIILHADALIALLQPFASAPAAPAPAAADSTVDAEGWIENTGRRPVADMVRVDVKFRCGDVHSGDYAKVWMWEKDEDDGGDIMHWRLHKPQEGQA